MVGKHLSNDVVGETKKHFSVRLKVKGVPLSYPFGPYVKFLLIFWQTSWSDHFPNSLLWPQFSVLKHKFHTTGSWKSLLSENTVFLAVGVTVLPETAFWVVCLNWSDSALLLITSHFHGNPHQLYQIMWSRSRWTL